MTISVAIPTLPKGCGNSWIYHEFKVDKKLEIKLGGLVGLGVFVVPNLPLFNVIGVSISLVKPPSWDLINF